jgi:hypothetical protein
MAHLDFDRDTTIEQFAAWYRDTQTGMTRMHSAQSVERAMPYIVSGEIPDEVWVEDFSTADTASMVRGMYVWCVLQGHGWEEFGG